MGRLTKKIDNRYTPKGDIKLGAYGQCVQKLGKYEDLEENGGLITLPCAVGDTLYYISYEKTIQEYEVAYITVTKEEIYVTFKANHKYNPRLHEASGSDFGTKLFLTKEEAEAKLKELEE